MLTFQYLFPYWGNYLIWNRDKKYTVDIFINNFWIQVVWWVIAILSKAKHITEHFEPKVIALLYR